MKKIIFISIIISLFASAAMAQVSNNAVATPPQDPILSEGPGGGGGKTNYYINSSGTITRSGYTYKYRKYKLSSTGFEIANMIQLYNADAIYLDVAWGRKEGTITEGEAMGYYRDPYYLSYRSLTQDELQALVASCFTARQLEDLKGSSMVVEALVNPDTGRVGEVYFSFRRSYPLVYIPVETFRKIELLLKEKLTITATDNGRKFNYLFFIWQQLF